MATKDERSTYNQPPVPVRKSEREVPTTDSGREISGTRILGEDRKTTTVFQTRPTPPDPKKK